MKYYINEKVISIGEKFDILDELGNIAYKVESKLFSIGKKTKIYDSNDCELIYLEQELLHLMPRFNLYYKGEYVCCVKKKVSFLMSEYEIPELNYMIDSGFMKMDFNIINMDTEDIVAKVYRKVFSIGDKYTIEINDLEHKDIIIGIFIVCALIINSEQGQN